MAAADERRLVTGDPDEHRDMVKASFSLQQLLSLRERTAEAPEEEENRVRFDDSEEALLLLTLCDPPKRPPVAVVSADVVGEDCSSPFRKQLTATDVSANHGRLLIWNRAAQETLLPLLKDSKKAGKDGISVRVYGRGGREYDMMVKLWSGKYYVLTSGWTQFFTDYGFQKDVDFVTVWMFAHKETGKLCFAIDFETFPVDKQLSLGIREELSEN